MLIDQLMPSYDAVTRVHRVVPGSPEAVYPAVRSADFLRAWRESAAVRVLFAARSAGERAIAAVRGGEFTEPPAPDSMRLADMPSRGEWILLGEDPPNEIAFGVVGRFWTGETSWLTIDRSEFDAFDRPGYARIACNFSLRAYGAGDTLVTYECRTEATDPESRRAFLRYWRPLAPFIDIVLRSHLRVVESQAAERSGS
jgi:hypothetical protein